MKIRFDNHSVSGVSRQYRGFVLELPGHSSREVDVPQHYVKDVLAYLSNRHPAVFFVPVALEKCEEAGQTCEESEETAASTNLEEAATGSQDGEEEEEDVAPNVKAGPAVSRSDKKKTKKSGGKR